MAGRHVADRKVKLKSVDVPSDFEMAKRLELPHVRELAASIKASGQLAPIIVVAQEGRQRPYKLVAGGDRFAAHLVNDAMWIDARIYEASDRDALEMHLIENAHRRHSQEERKRARQALIDLYSSDLPEAVPEEEREKLVTEKVAEAMAVQPESVQRAQRRQRKKERERAERPPKPDEADDGGIKDMGITMDAQWRAEAYKHRAHLTEAAKLIVRAQQLVATAARTGYGKESELLRLHETVVRMGKEVKGAIPTSVCPYCKALDGVLDSCAACGGTALITSSQWASVPEELLETGKKAVVYHHGRKWLVSELDKEREPEPEQERPEQIDPWEALPDG